MSNFKIGIGHYFYRARLVIVIGLLSIPNLLLNQAYSGPKPQLSQNLPSHGHVSSGPSAVETVISDLPSVMHSVSEGPPLGKTACRADTTHAYLFPKYSYSNGKMKFDEGYTLNDGPRSIVFGKPLGDGCNAIVYEAKIDGENRALKVIATQKGFTPNEVLATEEFKSSKNIVKSFGFFREEFETEEYPYSAIFIILEKADRTLKVDLLQNKSDILRIRQLKGIFDGLLNMYDKSYTHEDIKSENVLLRDDGTVLISDLGLARKIDDAEKFNRRILNFDIPELVLLLKEFKLNDPASQLLLEEISHSLMADQEKFGKDRIRHAQSKIISFIH